MLKGINWNPNFVSTEAERSMFTPERLRKWNAEYTMSWLYDLVNTYASNRVNFVKNSEPVKDAEKLNWNYESFYPTAESLGLPVRSGVHSNLPRISRFWLCKNQEPRSSLKSSHIMSSNHNSVSNSISTLFLSISLSHCHFPLKTNLLFCWAESWSHCSSHPTVKSKLIDIDYNE